MFKVLAPSYISLVILVYASDSVLNTCVGCFFSLSPVRYKRTRVSIRFDTEVGFGFDFGFKKLCVLVGVFVFVCVLIYCFIYP